MRFTRLLAAATLTVTLTACTNAPVLLEALDYDVGPPPATHDLALNGISLNSNDGKGLSTEQAEALFRVRQGQTVHFNGVLDVIRVRGNVAEIEVMPGKPSFAKQACRVADMRRRFGCRPEEQYSNTTVICQVDDWASLNRRTNGVMFDNWRNRNDHHSKWDIAIVEGTLDDLRPMRRNVSRYRGANLRYGDTGGFYTMVWDYHAFVLEGCRVRGYDGQKI